MSELVRCSHTLRGKKKFMCNDPVSGVKIAVECVEGVLAVIPRDLAEANDGVFTIVGGCEAENEDEKIDAPADADNESLDPPAADDGPDITEDLVDPPADDGKELVDPPADEDPEKKEDPGPDESEQAEANLKAQIEGFKDKGELDEYAKTLGVELDGRKSLKKMKAALIAELKL